MLAPSKASADEGVQLWQGFYAGMTPEEVLAEAQKYPNLRKPKILKKPSKHDWVDHAGTELWLAVDYGHNSTKEILGTPAYFRPYFNQNGRLESIIINLEPHTGACSGYRISEIEDAFEFWKTALKVKYPDIINGFPASSEGDRKLNFSDGKVVVEIYAKIIPPQDRSNNPNAAIRNLENSLRCFFSQYSVDIIYRSKDFYKSIYDRKMIEIIDEQRNSKSRYENGIRKDL